MHHRQYDSPSEDAILESNCNIYIKQMDLIWGMMKHVSYVGGGNLVAWYILIDKNAMYSILLLLLTSFLMLVFIITIRRQLYLQVKYGDAIRSKLKKTNRPSSGELNSKTFVNSIYKRPLSAAYLARLIPTTLLFSNYILLIISSIKAVQENSLLGFFMLALCLVIFVLFIANFKTIIDKLLHH